MSTRAANPITIEACILAGGLSTRMGRDKARLKLGGETMLARIRKLAARVFESRPAFRVRVIRKDRVRRCGPLGGVVTALRSSKAQAVLFLACDMPLVSPALLKRMVHASRGGRRAAFTSQNDRVGFPFVVPVEFLASVEAQMAAKDFSLHALAKRLRAQPVVLRKASRELCNVNTPEDAIVAGQLLKETQTRCLSPKPFPRKVTP